MVNTNLRFAAEPCGNELARDGVSADNIKSQASRYRPYAV